MNSSHQIADADINHRNAFDLVRLLLAASVIYTHGFLLCGREEPTFEVFKRQLSIGLLAVLGFFAVSGYLVSASWDRSPRVGRFLWSRVTRIVPGFLVCLLVTAFVVAPLLYLGRGLLLSEFPWGTGPEGATRFVLSNSLLRINQWSIGRALDGAPYGESLDGSLWSIFPEFTCYLFTLIGGWFGLLRTNRSLLLGLTAYVAIIHINNTLRPGPLTPADGPSFLTLGIVTKFYLAYLVGMLIWAYRDLVRPDAKACLFIALVMALVMKFGGLVLLAPIAIPIFLVGGAQLFVCRLRWDLSYGIYLYHFPLLQLIVLSDWLRERPILATTAGLLGSAVIAALSWRFVERPMSRLKRRAPSRSTRDVPELQALGKA